MAPRRAAGTPAAATRGGTKPPGESGPVEGKGVATIKGKIVYDGQPPAADDLTEQMMGQADKDYCLKDDPKNPNPTKCPQLGRQRGRRR